MNKTIVISASRRTDLPGFHYEWLQEVLKKGTVEVTNPFYRSKVYKVNLAPEEVHSIVLWSKDFRNVLRNPAYLDNYHLYFNYTMNNYARALEPLAPEYAQSLRTLEGMLKRYRTEQFNIRFDPIIISTKGEIVPTYDNPQKARLLAFANLCHDLKALGMAKCRVTTSYISVYGHVKKRFDRCKTIDIIDLTGEQQELFVQEMVAIADHYGLKLYSCASTLLERVPGVHKGHCIDGQLLEGLFGGIVSKAKDSGQREACGCTKSHDIGSYTQKCGHACFYCYQR